MTELTPSNELLAAARADRARLEGLWTRLKEQRAELSHQLSAVDAQIGDATQHLRRLAELVGDEHELPLSDQATEGVLLRGAAIRKTAVAVLLLQPDPEMAVHYKAWLQLVLDAGHEIAGRDPAAVFLTQVSRSPVVVRAPENGTYVLDRHALTRWRARLTELRRELGSLLKTERADHDSWDLEGLTTRIADLKLEASRAERHLGEAMATIRDIDEKSWFSQDEPFDGPSRPTMIEPTRSEAKAAA